MKKFLICLMSILFIFIGCSKMDTQNTDVNYDRTEIVFNSGLITKSATIVDGNVLPDGWKFGIAATYTSEYGSGVDENGNTFNKPDTTNFFGGFKTVEKDTVANGISVYHVTEGGPYYWPRTGSMTFYALSNGTEKLNATFNNSKLTLDNYDLSTIDNQKDLLYAKTIVNDVAYSTTGPVNLEFNHTLAQIVFQFSKSTILNSTEVKITSVKVNVPNTKANFDSSNNKYWTTIDGSEKTFSILSTAYDCKTTLEKAGESILVFPQTLPNDVIVTITYQTKVFGWTRNRVATIKGSALKGEWLAGHKYTYNIEVSTSEILFTSRVGTWTPDGNVIY